MARTQSDHKELTNGVGKCSVPMWRNGLPAGFCDEPAYGRHIPGETYRDAYTGRLERLDGKYNGYVPALACPMHGGPATRTVDVVFDGPPSHEPGRFVEVEDRNGMSVRIGEWVQRQDGYWVLRIPVTDEAFREARETA